MPCITFHPGPLAVANQCQISICSSFPSVKFGSDCVLDMSKCLSDWLYQYKFVICWGFVFFLLSYFGRIIQNVADV